MLTQNNDIHKAAAIIKSGGLVAFPTETVYGLGANALNPLSVAKIFEAKKRPFFDPLIVHIADIKDLKKLVINIPKPAQKLIDHFWPGPLTIIFKKSKIVPDLVTAGFNTVAVRMPDHPIALKLIKTSQCPIAAPSANPFGRLSPTQASHVRKYLSKEVDLIIDGGKCKKGLESTIVDTTQTPLIIRRVGALPIEDIQKIIGNVSFMNSNKETLAPGEMPSHYAPRTKLILLKENDSFPKPKKGFGYLIYDSRETMLKNWPHVKSLSPKGNLLEAAANLFSSLHELDDQGLDIIYVKTLPPQGIGIAIMDRLTKAANAF